MNDLAENLRPCGMRLGLHNHAIELQKFEDGRLPLESIFDNTSKEIAQQLHLVAWPAAGWTLSRCRTPQFSRRRRSLPQCGQAIGPLEWAGSRTHPFRSVG